MDTQRAAPTSLPLNGAARPAGLSLLALCSHLAALCALLVLASCAPWQARVAQHVEYQRFAEASELLVENGAGEAPAADLDAEGKAVRAAFTTAIETTTASECLELIEGGAVRAALRLCEERIRQCPWSLTLPEYQRDCAAKVEQIHEAEQAWLELLTHAPVTRETLRRTLADASARPSWYFDSPILPMLLPVMQSLLAEANLGKLQADQFRLSTTDAVEFVEELRLARVDLEQERLLLDLQELLRALSANAEKRPSDLTLEELHALGAARQLAATRPAELRSARAASNANKGLAAEFVEDNSGDPRLTRLKLKLANEGTRTTSQCMDACIAGSWTAIGNWAVTHLGAALADPDIDGATLAEGEAWIHPDLLGNRLRTPLARAHVNTAARISRDSTACHLAQLHLARARRLGLTNPDPAHRDVIAAVRATRRLNPRVAVRTSVRDEFFGLAYFGFYSAAYKNFLASFSAAIAAKGPTLAELVESEQDTAGLMLLFRVIDATEYMEKEDTRAVQSSYIDGYIEVANEEKLQLQREIEQYREKIAAAARELENAWAQYRAAPSEWTSYWVNFYKDSRKVLIDSHNELVDQHNALPDTVTEPSMTPYSFEESVYRVGVKLTVVVRRGNGFESTYSHATSMPFPFRSGCAPTDVNPAYRMDTESETLSTAQLSLHEQMRAAIDAVAEKMNLDLGRLPFALTVELSPEQTRILQWLLHPRGIQKDIAAALGVPAWAIEAADVEELTSLDD